MRPTQSKVVVEELPGGRQEVSVNTYFTDKTPPEYFGSVAVRVRDNAVMLSRGTYDGQLFLTLESIPSIVEAIKKAQEIGK